MTCWVNLGGKENVERTGAGENSTLPPRVSAGAKWLADHGTTSDGQIATQVDTRVLQQCLTSEQRRKQSIQKRATFEPSACASRMLATGRPAA